MGILKATDLVKIYPGAHDVCTTHNHTNLFLNKEGLAAIVGDSSSGKSTLLNALASVDQVDSAKFSSKAPISPASTEEIDKISFVFLNKSTAISKRQFSLSPMTKK